MCKPVSKASECARTFTWAEVEKSAHSSKGNVTAGPLYVVINKKVYDLGGDFFRWHPGGAVAASQLGQDATGAFDVFHSPATHETLANFYAGDLAASEVPKPNAFAGDVQKLRDTIDSLNLYESSKLWYATKIAQTIAIAVASVAVLAWKGDSVLGVAVSGLMMATFWQQSGWLAHDLCHHQVFQNRFYNDAVAYFMGNVAQGFSIAWWKHKHSTHHAVPNVHETDPDIDTLPFLAWSEHALDGFSDLSDATLAKFMVKYQPIIFFPLLSLARMAWAFQSLMWNAPGSNQAQEFPTRSKVESVTLGIHYLWVLGAAFGLASPMYGLLWLLISQCGCGFLLAVVFAVNHNGMPVYSRTDSAAMNYYELAIVTARNVEPTAFNNWFTGGLNFQIEHHMFPTIPRHNLHRVAPLVESLCKKHAVPYHRTSLSRGVVEVVDRLSAIAKASVKTRRA
ncbi:fatty acid desaturase-domain-containing protein [Blyttiomyces helicus]|uniref:Fatty acid desaturase-domain-containing protein n=1 Tax=Blyttiomyces helicus TaxID=388810 RepID=A0A4P9W913_9FUNG|nr:fatty acid desaturase-domain-containing protein [Blyttiomyces helicus]|eukprot:RKO87963.1 fatty acid desaturase-domain-containing protein [Blyttiomyces helicus]